jgi:hypothetical protein
MICWIKKIGASDFFWTALPLPLSFSSIVQESSVTVVHGRETGDVRDGAVRGYAAASACAAGRPLQAVGLGPPRKPAGIAASPFDKRRCPTRPGQ